MIEQPPCWQVPYSGQIDPPPLRMYQVMISCRGIVIWHKAQLQIILLFNKDVYMLAGMQLAQRQSRRGQRRSRGELGGNGGRGDAGASRHSAGASRSVVVGGKGGLGERGRRGDIRPRRSDSQITVKVISPARAARYSNPCITAGKAENKIFTYKQRYYMLLFDVSFHRDIVGRHLHQSSMQTHNIIMLQIPLQNKERPTLSLPS